MSNKVATGDFEFSHGLHQEANDWIMCRCGKLFSDSKTKTKWDKFENHLEEMRNDNGKIKILKGRKNYPHKPIITPKEIRSREVKNG
jgi:hypothetical protein